MPQIPRLRPSASWCILLRSKTTCPTSKMQLKKVHLEALTVQIKISRPCDRDTPLQMRCMLHDYWLNKNAPFLNSRRISKCSLSNVVNRVRRLPMCLKHSRSHPHFHGCATYWSLGQRLAQTCRSRHLKKPRNHCRVSGIVDWNRGGFSACPHRSYARWSPSDN